MRKRFRFHLRAGTGLDRPGKTRFKDKGGMNGSPAAP